MIGRGRSVQTIQAVEGGDTVSFGHGRVVECGIDEIHQGVGFAFLCHDRLADMNDFRGLVPETVYAEQFQGLCMKQNLKHADGFTCNLRACQTLNAA